MPRLSVHPNAMLHLASDIDAATFTAICLASCKRLPAMRRTAEAQHLDLLVQAGAWTDAALALIALELPNWQLRRLTFDEGEWHCALSPERNMPDWLDDAIETRHPNMASAILEAFRSAIDREGTSHLVIVPISTIERTDFTPMLCENYC